MNNFKWFKRKMLIRLMTFLGFGGMAAFCISSCQQGSSNNDKQPSQATNPQDSVQASPQSDLPALAPTAATDAQNPDQQNDNNAELDNNPEPEQVVVEPNNPPDPQKPVPEYAPHKYGSPHRKPFAILDPDDLKSELKILNRKIQFDCQTEPGDLIVEFTLTPSGEVTKLKTKSGSLKGTKSEECILKQLSNYQFVKKVTKNQRVTFPFKFDTTSDMELIYNTPSVTEVMGNDVIK